MAKKSAKNKTVLPDPLPKGEILIDIAKKKWILGPSIGVGGFGEIYSAAAGEGSKKDYQYVIKIEPHGNGPLFCEMHFFMRNSKPDMIQAWCSQKNMKSLGMPRYLGSGSHDHKEKKYRFLVMDKYGKDLWCIFLENNRKFPSATVYRIAIQLLNVLEYIHNNGYIHADIKGANILSGLTKATEEQVFLVDFGLASHYTKKEYKPDPKKAHNGTIEYTSRDAHEGVATRRGDLEILAYNMIQWMGCKLPWEKNLTDPVAVHKSKKVNMQDIMGFTKLCFGNYTSVPAALIEFLDYIKHMQYDAEPNYTLIRNLFLAGLKSSGGSLTGPLKFQMIQSDEPTGATPKKQAKLDLKPKGRGRPKKNTVTSTKADLQNGVEQGRQNVEMMRLQKKITDRITGKETQTMKTVHSSSVSDSEEDDDENIPLQQRCNAKRMKLADRTPGKKTQTVKAVHSSSESGSEEDDENIPLQQRSNAGMMGIQKKIADRKTGKKTQTVKAVNSLSVSNSEEEDDDDENTPIQQKYNAEMMRIQKKIADRKTGKKTQTVKAVNSLSVSNSEEDDDADDNTPIQQRYNAEMMRIQKKIADRKTGKKRQTVKAVHSLSVSNSEEEDDADENTPIKQRYNAQVTSKMIRHHRR